MPANRFHDWLEQGKIVTIAKNLNDSEVSDEAIRSEEVDDRGRTPLAVLAEQARSYSHILADVGVRLVGLNPEALITRDKEGKTSLDIASRSGACAEIISLLSLTPEEARSLGGKEMRRLYAPVAYMRRVPKSSLEEAQEDVQGAVESASE